MYKEVNFCGIFLSPFFVRLLITAVMFVPLHRLGDRLHIQRFFWNRPVVEAALFLILLTLVTLY